MDKLLQPLAQLLLLRIGPQDLPASRALERLAIMWFFGADMLTSLLGRDVFGNALIAAGTDTLLLVLLVRLGLTAAGHPARRMQTLTALASTGAAITLISAPLVALISFGGGSAKDVLGLFIAGLALWNLSIWGHILRHAFEVVLVAGVSMAVAFMLGSILLINLITNGLR